MSFWLPWVWLSLLALLCGVVGGAFLHRRCLPGDEPTARLFLCQSLGYIVVLSSWALLLSRGRTFMLLALLLAWMVRSSLPRRQTPPVSGPLLTGARFWLLCGAVYLGSTLLLHNRMAYVDTLNYAATANAMTLTGVENSEAEDVLLSPAMHPPAPYHYFELWPASLVGEASRLPYVTVLQFVIYPYLVALCAWGGATLLLCWKGARASRPACWLAGTVTVAFAGISLPPWTGLESSPLAVWLPLVVNPISPLLWPKLLPAVLAWQLLTLFAACGLTMASLAACLLYGVQSVVAWGSALTAAAPLAWCLGGRPAVLKRWLPLCGLFLLGVWWAYGHARSSPALAIATVHVAVPWLRALVNAPVKAVLTLLPTAVFLWLLARSLNLPGAQQALLKTLAWAAVGASLGSLVCRILTYEVVDSVQFAYLNWLAPMTVLSALLIPAFLLGEGRDGAPEPQSRAVALRLAVAGAVVFGCLSSLRIYSSSINPHPLSREFLDQVVAAGRSSHPATRQLFVGTMPGSSYVGGLGSDSPWKTNLRGVSFAGDLEVLYPDVFLVPLHEQRLTLSTDPTVRSAQEQYQARGSLHRFWAGRARPGEGAAIVEFLQKQQIPVIIVDRGVEMDRDFQNATQKLASDPLSGSSLWRLRSSQPPGSASTP